MTWNAHLHSIVKRTNVKNVTNAKGENGDIFSLKVKKVTKVESLKYQESRINYHYVFDPYGSEPPSKATFGTLGARTFFSTVAHCPLEFYPDGS